MSSLLWANSWLACLLNRDWARWLSMDAFSSECGTPFNSSALFPQSIFHLLTQLWRCCCHHRCQYHIPWAFHHSIRPQTPRVDAQVTGWQSMQWSRGSVECLPNVGRSQVLKILITFPSEPCVFTLSLCFDRMGGEQDEQYFCDNKSLSMQTLRMTCEAKVGNTLFVCPVLSPLALVSYRISCEIYWWMLGFQRIASCPRCSITMALILNWMWWVSFSFRLFTVSGLDVRSIGSICRSFPCWVWDSIQMSAGTKRNAKSWPLTANQL